MNDYRTAQKAAFQIQRQYHILVPSLDDIVHIIRDHQFEIIDYTPGNISGALEDLVHELSLESLVAIGNTFAFQKGEIRLIFICSAYSTEEKRVALAHELGHIVCRHLTLGSCAHVAVGEEYEANEFAHYLLHPSLASTVQLWLYSHKAATIIVTALILALLIFFLMIHIYKVEESYYGNYYRTENGEKYHLEDCIYIEGRTNVHRLTVDEYESGQFTPCKICLPSDNSSNTK